MEKAPVEQKKILLVYFSFSSQTKNLVHALIEGLKGYDLEITKERVETMEHFRFPIGSIPQTIIMMFSTFMRKRIPIKPLSDQCFKDYDLIILAGPTWSYNPSGAILSLFDRDGAKLFNGKKVLPLISCRGYWRVHWWGLKNLLRKNGASVANLIVFSHPSPEPWRTIGVFLKLAGRMPEKKSWIAKYYNKYGHTRAQLQEAKRFGQIIGEALKTNQQLEQFDFKTKIANP